MRITSIGIAIGLAFCSGCSDTAAKAEECKIAAFQAYCAGATAGLSQGSLESDPDLSTALKVKSSAYSAAFPKKAYASMVQRYLRAGAEESARISDARMMQSILALCVDGDGRARESFANRVALECSRAAGN